MILEFEDQPFHVLQEESAPESREPQHEEAIKALMDGHNQLFVDLLVGNNMGQFKLPAQKVAAETRNLKEDKEKEEFQKVFTQKLVQLMKSSEVHGRFFENPQQVSLHNYIKFQYFECEQGMEPDKQILNCYRTILQRIMNIDDLVHFMDFLLGLHLIEELNSILRKSIEVLSSEKPVESDLEVIRTLNQRNEEEKLVIRLCLTVMVKALGRKEDNNRVNVILGQHLVIGWAKLFGKWSGIEQVRNTPFFKKVLTLFFGIFSYEIDREDEFPILNNFQSEFSKALFELLRKLVVYPTTTNGFKGIKTIIFRWSLQLLPNNQQIGDIIQKFMNCFFSDELNLKVRAGEDVFETPAMCRNVKRKIGQSFMEHVAKKAQIIEIQKIRSSHHPSAKKYQQFFFKLGLLINSRILGQQVEVFAFNMMKFYLQYAHVWPALHSYRMWILQVCKDTSVQKYDDKIDLLRGLQMKLFEQIDNETREVEDGWNKLSKQTIELFNEFYAEVNLQINALRLKRNKNVIEKMTYDKYFQFMIKFEEKVHTFRRIQVDQGKESSQFGSVVERELNELLQELKISFRYNLCNSTKFLSMKEEIPIMERLGGLLINIVESKADVSDYRWKFLCDIFGINDVKYKSTISRRQILGPMQRYTAKLNNKIEQFLPFNLAVSIYNTIRPKYKDILKYLFDSLVANESQESLWLVLQKIMLPSVLVSGSCIFNGQVYEKTKEELAFGLYYDQFQRITEILTEATTINKNIRTMVFLQNKKKIFSRFYQILRSKNVKIVEKAKAAAPEGYNRYRRNMSNEQVIQNLAQMGVSREEADIALQNIEYPDHNLAMDWLDNNQDRIEEILVARTLERTRREVNRNDNRVPEVGANQIAPLPFDKFYQKERLIKLSRSWIKIIFKELFKEESFDISQTLKNILFMFMDSLKAEVSQNQYNNLNEKLYSDIDTLNKKENITNQFCLQLSILEGTFTKTQKARKDFYEKSVNLKIISYLPRVKLEEEPVNKIFSLLNSTLPVFNNSDPITSELEHYLAHLLDLVLLYRGQQKSQCDIMLKIAKTGKQELMQRITRNLTIFFKENLIKQSIFSLTNIILTSDKELSNINAELDLKTFLYERYKHRIANFQPEKEHILEVDINEFQRSFQKYDRGSAIYEVAKKMLMKKKNKNKLLYYDCKVKENEFNVSKFGNCQFISYPLKEHYKTMIKSLLQTLFEAQSKEVEENILTDIYKLLYYFRILIPFTIYEQVQGKNLLDWLLFSQNRSKRKYKFLLFLTTSVNLFVKKQNYSFYSLSDYICARIIKAFTTGDRDIVWSSFCALYLSQVRKFSDFCSSHISGDRQISLIEHYESKLIQAKPLEYVNISEFLYVHYKKRVLDNLRRKYKFINNQNEMVFDRQFLSLSAFFNNLPMKKNIRLQKLDRPPHELLDIMPHEEVEDDQEEPQMMFHQNRLFGRHRLGMPREHFQPQAQIEQIISPLPIPQPPQPQEQKEEEKKEGEEKQVLVEEKKEPEKLQPIIIKNKEYINDILQNFEKYLSFQEEVASKFDLMETNLPRQAVVITNFNLGFNVKVEEVYVDLDLRVKKMAGFEKRIGEIYSVLVPKGQWDEKKENSNSELRPPNYLNLGRRLIQTLSNPQEQSRDTLLTLERLIQGRYGQRQQIANPNPPRNLNINDIYQHMEEYTEPVVQPPPSELIQNVEIKQLPAQILPLAEQAVQQPQPSSSQQAQRPNQPMENVQESEPPKEPIQQEKVEEKPKKVILVNLKAQEKIEEKPQQKIEEKMEKVEQVQKMEIEHNQPVQEEEIVENPPSQEIKNEESVPKVENPPSEEQINPVPVSNAENSEAPPPAEQPPARERQILTMLGLPQSFLRDVGLDEEFFDSLPEDLQQQQLMTFMAQQQANLNRQGQGGNNPPPQPNQPQDLQSQNVVFLQTLDPTTRAQILLQATPEMLASLPPRFREQAQRHRSNSINRIIEQEQIQEERNIVANNQRPKQPVAYPKIYKQEFSKINEAAAKYIFKGIFNIYPKFKLASLKVLLQNKHLQDITISSIIALINSFEQKEGAPIILFNKVEHDKNQVKVSIGVTVSVEQIGLIRSHLLHTILEQLRIPLFKDEDFLSSQIKNEVYQKDLEQYRNGKEFINPVVQLTRLALNYYPDLATQLLKKSKDLPDDILKKIVTGIRNEEWPNDLYESLSSFSQNERLKQIFEEEFQEKPPKIQILGKLLKFKFAQLSSLKRIHEKALQEYSPSYIQFLNQIFSIYTVETLNQIEPLLIKHKQTHLQVIKTLYQMGKQVMKEPIGLILKKPQLLDFETKKFIFRNHPKLRKQNTGRRVHIEVDRAHLFQGSYNQLMNRTTRELEGKVHVAFINEPGYDAGGLKREWFLLVSRQIFNQDYGLFEKSSSGSTYQPNPKSYINPDHLNYFKFIGRFIGKALVEKQLIDAYFTRAFYKMILGQELEFKDLQAQDYEFYKSMEWLKNNPIDENMFTFSYIYDNFGNKIEKELVPGGKQIIVCEENKIEYVQKYCMSKMRDNFEAQVNKFLEGFHEIVPQECISFFQAKELELLISGVPEVDVEDFKRNTDYSGYNPTDQIIGWFWEVVSEYSQQDLAKLVQFITGTSKIPLEGFSHLIGMNGVQRISIHRDPIEHQLPKSHTCFNQLDLPNYATKEILKQKLGICLAWGSEGFGFM